MNTYQQANSLYDQLGSHVPADGALKLPPIQLAHYQVFDTALAACLGTLDIPFREPAPFTDDVELDAAGNEMSRRVCFWMGDVSPGGDQAHKTEEIFGAWNERERFEKEHPLHPLVAMRAAIDARNFWVQVIHAFQSGRAILPVEVVAAIADRVYKTTSIHGASVLKACGFEPLAFDGRAFILPASTAADLMHAEEMLLLAAQERGATPPQWMARVLKNYSHLLNIAKQRAPILRQRDGDSTLLLSADATAKTRDKFHALL